MLALHCCTGCGWIVDFFQRGCVLPSPPFPVLPFSPLPILLFLTLLSSAKANHDSPSADRSVPSTTSREPTSRTPASRAAAFLARSSSRTGSSRSKKASYAPLFLSLGSKLTRNERADAARGLSDDFLPDLCPSPLRTPSPHPRRARELRTLLSFLITNVRQSLPPAPARSWRAKRTGECEA